MATVELIIPAYNKAGRIGPTVAAVPDRFDTLVVDDGLTDDTALEARKAGARVVAQPENRGYIAALRRGFRESTAAVVVTVDADGEHRPADIDRLVEPVLADRLDLVLGARETIPRPSERLLNWLARRRIDVSDSGTGLRALRRDLAVQLELDTACTCGTLALEAANRGARIGEIDITTREIRKPRGIAWGHGRQLFHVLEQLLRS